VKRSFESNIILLQIFKSNSSCIEGFVDFRRKHPSFFLRKTEICLNFKNKIKVENLSVLGASHTLSSTIILAEWCIMMHYSSNTFVQMMSYMSP